jgi:hypothetical protein
MLPSSNGLIAKVAIENTCALLICNSSLHDHVSYSWACVLFNSRACVLFTTICPIHEHVSNSRPFVLFTRARVIFTREWVLLTSISVFLLLLVKLCVFGIIHRHPHFISSVIMQLINMNWLQKVRGMMWHSLSDRQEIVNFEHTRRMVRCCFHV